MIAVVNSSPLIKLAAIDSLELLKSIYGTVHIPKAVFHEVVVTGRGRPGAKEVSKAAWIKRPSVKDKQAVAELTTAMGLDQGESEAIVLATELQATTIILDDASARQYAKTLHLLVIGTAGVLLLAKLNKLVPSVRKPLDALVSAGLYLDPKTYRKILQRAGED